MIRPQKFSYQNYSEIFISHFNSIEERLLVTWFHSKSFSTCGVWNWHPDKKGISFLLVLNWTLSLSFPQPYTTSFIRKELYEFMTVFMGYTWAEFSNPFSNPWYISWNLNFEMMTHLKTIYNKNIVNRLRILFMCVKPKWKMSWM